MTQRSNPKTKKAQLVAMLRRKAGADVGVISQNLGWQPHTTRAALSRLRKEGLRVIKDEASGNQSARYRIVAEPATREPKKEAIADAR